MCGICGCSDTSESHHAHEANTLHHHDHTHATRIQVERDLLAQNREYAQKNRQYFIQNGITSVNLMSSPGSGKTSLLVKTLGDLQARRNFAVVVADQQTRYDADALMTTGVQAVQINTGKVCHIDAHMLGHSLDTLPLEKDTLLFIENIGNLVCPALFDLGEHARVVILSVTEGDNKPLKYPDMFHRADLVLITKTDLLPYVDFDVERCLQSLQKINPGMQSICLSAKTGEGLDLWYQWLLQKQTA